MPNRSWFRRPPLLNIADDRGAGPVVVLIHGTMLAKLGVVLGVAPLAFRTIRASARPVL